MVKMTNILHFKEKNKKINTLQLDVNNKKMNQDYISADYSSFIPSK